MPTVSTVIVIKKLVMPSLWHENGRLYSMDWTRDWTVGLDCGTGVTESCAPLILKQHKHYYTTVHFT